MKSSHLGQSARMKSSHLYNVIMLTYKVSLTGKFFPSAIFKKRVVRLLSSGESECNQRFKGTIRIKI